MILKIKGDWQDVIDDCRSTVNKPPLNKEPSDKFKQDIMISEHSPIRDISVRWKWCDIPYWLSTEFSRHKFEKFITTQRTDRTGENRDKKPQDSPVDFVGDANSQHLIDMMRKRLCVGCASKQAYKKALELKKEIKTILPELANVLVPNCIYRCGCPEINSNNCAYFNVFARWLIENDYEFFDIQSRYDAYNEYIERK